MLRHEIYIHEKNIFSPVDLLVVVVMEFWQSPDVVRLVGVVLNTMAQKKAQEQ